jgi:hypothetical protein
LALLGSHLDPEGRLATEDPKARPALAAKLRLWQQDRDLASLREPDAVAKLPPDEQERCKQLWAKLTRRLGEIETKE